MIKLVGHFTYQCRNDRILKNSNQDQISVMIFIFSWIFKKILLI